MAQSNGSGTRLSSFQCAGMGDSSPSSTSGGRIGSLVTLFSMFVWERLPLLKPSTGRYRRFSFDQPRTSLCAQDPSRLPYADDDMAILIHEQGALLVFLGKHGFYRVPHQTRLHAMTPAVERGRVRTALLSLPLIAKTMLRLSTSMTWKT